MGKEAISLIAVTAAALLVTGCTATATPEPEPSPATPSPEVQETPEPRSFSEDELRAALMTTEDFAATLADPQALESDDSDEESGDVYIEADEACVEIADGDHNPDIPHVYSEFEWSGGLAYQRLAAYESEEQLLETEEKFLALAADCNSAVFPGEHSDITETFHFYDQQDLDSRYAEFGHEMIVRTITYSTEHHGDYATYLLAEVKVEHLLAVVGVSAAERVEDDLFLPLVERAIERTEALLGE